MLHGVKRIQLSAQARKAKLAKDHVRIANYKVLTKRVLEGKANKVYTNSALQDTTTLLNLNPEFNAVWNYRRNIFSHLFDTSACDRTEALNNDLFMSMDMMKRYPKCYWIWNHRRWCLEMLDNTKNADWARELAIALKVLLMDRRNFHGWHYRRYIVSQMEKKIREDELDTLQRELEINLCEFEYTTEVINKSTSNFSAWHNRTKLITKIFLLLSTSEEFAEIFDVVVQDRKSAEIFGSSVKLLKHELNLVKTGMFMDADDTSVWLYMQWLLTDDLFVSKILKETYIEILQQQLSDVMELNDLEKEDGIASKENIWCLKTIIFLRALLNHTKDKTAKTGLADDNDDETLRALNLLVELDPLRRGHYLDQLQRKASIVC